MKIKHPVGDNLLGESREQRVEEKKEDKEKEAHWWQGRRPLKREWSGKDLSEFPHNSCTVAL